MSYEGNLRVSVDILRCLVSLFVGGKGVAWLGRGELHGPFTHCGGHDDVGGRKLGEGKRIGWGDTVEDLARRKAEWPAELGNFAEERRKQMNFLSVRLAVRGVKIERNVNQGWTRLLKGPRGGRGGEVERELNGRNVGYFVDTNPTKEHCNNFVAVLRRQTPSIVIAII